MAFSTKHLLFAFIVAAIGLVALLNADLPILAELIDLLTLITLILCAYGIWVTQGAQRAFRIGFVAWAGIYFVLTKKWDYSWNLATGKLITIASEIMFPSRITELNVSDPTGERFLAAQAEWIGRYTSIAHCLFALGFGVLGGWVTVHFYRKRQQMLATMSTQPSSEQVK
jgi:hypothetical protein